MSEDLKNCPFCDNPVKLNTDVLNFASVNCQNKKCAVTMYVLKSGIDCKKKVIEIWNTRA